MGKELTRENDVDVRQGEYFVQLLNGDEISELGGQDWRKERVVREVVREETIGALKKMKGGKAAGMDNSVL